MGTLIFSHSSYECEVDKWKKYLIIAVSKWHGQPHSVHSVTLFVCSLLCCKYIYIYIYILYQCFLHRHWRFIAQQGKRGDHLLFHSTTSTRSRTLRHLQLCMWDDYHVFLIATLVFTRLLLDYIYHLIELPFVWLINDAMFVCLFTWWIGTRFSLQRFDIENRWMWTRIQYQPCITSEPTNQVC